MKITVKDAAASLIALRQFGQLKIPFQPSMMIAKNGKILQEVEDEFQRRRQLLGKELGEVDEQGNTVILPANVDYFQEKMAEILNEELDLDLKTVSLDELKGDNERPPDVEPNLLVPLQWMITMQGQRPTKKRGQRKGP